MYWPVLNAGEPISKPPATCWHGRLVLPAENPAKAHVTGITLMMRGLLPGAPTMAAVMLPGRRERTCCWNCGVVMNWLLTATVLLRKPSYEKKKKALFLAR